MNSLQSSLPKALTPQSLREVPAVAPHRASPQEISPVANQPIKDSVSYSPEVSEGVKSGGAETVVQGLEQPNCDNSQDLRSVLMECLTNHNKASRFLGWISGDSPCKIGGCSPAQALDKVNQDTEMAEMFLKLRSRSLQSGSSNLEEKLLDKIASNPAAASAQINALSKSMASGGKEYLEKISQKPELSEKFVKMQASAASNDEGRDSLKKYYKSLKDNPDAAREDAKIEQSASKSPQGRDSVKKLKEGLAEDPEALEAAQEARRVAGVGERSESKSDQDPSRSKRKSEGDFSGP